MAKDCAKTIRWWMPDEIGVATETDRDGDPIVILAPMDGHDGIAMSLDCAEEVAAALGSVIRDERKRTQLATMVTAGRA